MDIGAPVTLYLGDQTKVVTTWEDFYESTWAGWRRKKVVKVPAPGADLASMKATLDAVRQAIIDAGEASG